jgi:hypothetical protein
MPDNPFLLTHCEICGVEISDQRPNRAFMAGFATFSKSTKMEIDKIDQDGVVTFLNDPLVAKVESGESVSILKICDPCGAFLILGLEEKCQLLGEICYYKNRPEPKLDHRVEKGGKAMTPIAHERRVVDRMLKETDD